MWVDFHTHSSASDGTLSPSELAAAGAQAGLVFHALTDHDNCKGIDSFYGRLETNDSGHNRPCLISGIELSIEAGPDFDKFHLLGLGLDPMYGPLADFLSKVLKGRNERNAQIIANFNRLGIGIGEEIFKYANGDVLARPHFARWLVERGYAASAAEAFEKYLLPDSPKETRCYEERFHPPQEEAIALVHAAGGLAVLAHPKYGRKEWCTTGPDYAVAERALAALKEKGLDGVEAFYQANTIEENVTFTRIADRLGFLKTAGSDFHGGNKPAVTLGMQVEERFIAPFLEHLEALR